MKCQYQLQHYDRVPTQQGLFSEVAALRDSTSELNR